MELKTFLFFIGLILSIINTMLFITTVIESIIKNKSEDFKNVISLYVLISIIWTILYYIS